MPSATPRTTSPQRLSQGLISSLKPEERDYYIRDSEVRGLQLKVTPAGNKSFVLRYRNEDGREKKIKLGNYPALTASGARLKGKEHLAKVALGEDPADTRTARRRGMTFAEYSEQFLVEHVDLHLADSTQQEYRRLLRRYLYPDIGGFPMANITREDMEAIKRKMSGTHHQANRVLALARKIFNHAIENNHAQVQLNPAQHVKSFKELPRERILNPSEQGRVIQAIRELRKAHPENTPSYDAISFLFLTGRRRSEVLQLKWTDIDFERGIIYYRKTKTDPQKGDLTDDMRRFLLDIKALSSSEYVFPGRTIDQPLKDPKRSWAAIQKLAGLEGVRLHDIRHTVVSEVTSSADLQSAALVAGHKSLQSTMRYVHGRSAVATKALQDVGANRSGLLSRGRGEGITDEN
ncbi:tyrosine-type recombinase/integrase [Salipiger sp.]|uniref:tyrosine-type recombinase/integrase n=1 Tax=Salipiger sp. TaxID=2078585 RepID=UPI003A9837CA